LVDTRRPGCKSGDHENTNGDNGRERTTDPAPHRNLDEGNGIRYLSICEKGM
jgi:hypothetical protein